MDREEGDIDADGCEDIVMCSAGSTKVDVCLVDMLLMSMTVANTFDTPPVVVLKGDKVKRRTTLGHERTR